MQEISKTVSPSDTTDRFGELIEGQKALINSQQSFIRIQQHLTAQQLLKSGAPGFSATETATFKEVVDQREDEILGLREALETPKLPTEKEPGDEPSANTPANQSESVFSRQGTLFALTIGLSAVVVFLLFSGSGDLKGLRETIVSLRTKLAEQDRFLLDQHEQSSNEIKRLQGALTANQNALLDAQIALSLAQDKLRAQQTLESNEHSASSVSDNSKRTIVQSPPFSDEEKLRVMIQDIGSIKNAILENDNSYAVNAKDLALNRRLLRIIKARILIKDGQVPDQDPDSIEKTPLENFMPDEVKSVEKSRTELDNLTKGPPRTIVAANRLILQLNAKLITAQALLGNTTRELETTRSAVRESMQELALK